MIDIHSHILPNVDDGAENIEESIAMARIYLDNGINKVIATPHYIEGYENSIKENNVIALEKLKEALDKEGLDLKVYLGNEIYISMDIPSLIKEGKVATLNDSRYVLIEFPMIDMPMYTESVIYELLLKGYIPIIAHPERYSSIIEDPNILYELISKGALAQLNLPSLEGKYGEEIKNTAEILLKYNMIHLVGTDAHSKGRRAPYVKKSLDLLIELVGETVFIEITYLNPLKVISNEIISPNTPIKYKKPKGFLHFFKNKIK